LSGEEAEALRSQPWVVVRENVQGQLRSKTWEEGEKGSHFDIDAAEGPASAGGGSFRKQTKRESEISLCGLAKGGEGANSNRPHPQKRD